MGSKTQYIHTVVNTRALTIDNILDTEGNKMYRVEARTRKYLSAPELKDVKNALEKELARVGVISDRAEYDRRKYQRDLERNREVRRAYWLAHKDEINAKRRMNYKPKKN